MIRSWQAREIIPILTLAALMSISSVNIPAGEEEFLTPWQDNESALEISSKAYNEETGKLVLILKNRSDLTITALGVVLVSSDSTGRGSTMLQAEEFFPGDGVAPRASYEMVLTLGTPGQTSPKFSARAALLHHEIRSDNSSYGHAATVDKLFQERAAYYVEYKAVLNRLRARKEAPDVSRPMLSFFEEEAERGEEARRDLLEDTRGQISERERARLSAVASVSHIARQVFERVTAGLAGEELFAQMEDLFEQEMLNASRNIRPVDLERYEK